MYEGYKIYGPYLSKQGRRVIVLYKSSSERTSISYARYLLSLKIGRELRDNEEADHIDGNKLNDHPNNLQILTRLENNRKDRQRTYVKLTCPQCHAVFARERRQTHIIKGGRPTCCSRSCAGKYQHRAGILSVS
jgi:hypothetical protein